MSTAQDIQTGICVYDQHFPYHNKKLWENILRVIEDLKPNYFIFGGDNLDMDAVNHWELEKGNKRGMEGKRLRKTYDDYNSEIMDQLKVQLPDYCRKIWMYGNHSEWLEQYIDKCPELEGFAEIERNVHLDGWEIYRYHQTVKVGKIYFHHGEYTCKYHASKMVDVFEKNIVYGHLHCFDQDTEILSKRGWLKYNEIQESDHVMTMDKNTEKLEWNKINDKVVYDTNEDMYRVKNTRVDLLIDGEHGVVWKSDKKYKKIHYTTMKDLYNRNGQFLFKVSGELKETHKEYPISDDLLKIIAWTLSEGNMYKIGNTCYVDISQSKQVGIDQIKEVLLNLNFDYKLFERKKEGISKLTPYRFRIHAKDSKIIHKYIVNKNKVSDWFYELSNRQFELFLDEYIKGDGTQYPKRHVKMIYSNSEEWINYFQTMLALNGYRTNIYWRDSGSTLKFKKRSAQMNITKRQWTWVSSNTITKENYVGKKWCVSVDNGTLLIRRNGNTCITQNTSQSYTKVTPVDGEAHMAISMPCACDLNPRYMKDKPSAWVNGFGVFYIMPNGNFNVYPIISSKDHFIFNGKYY